MKKIKLAKQPLIAAIAMLLLAIPPMWPYGYYMFLRLIICGVSVYVAVKAREVKHENIMWGMAFFVLLFNPIFPIPLGKGLWVIIDLVLAGVFIKLLSNGKK